MGTFTPRTPTGIRRHYSPVESLLTEALSTGMASDVTKRSHTAIHAKKQRIAGTRVDTHHKDGSGKYRAQHYTRPRATNHGTPWNDWEDRYLLRDPHKQSLATKAIVLGRTYRACESRRRDLLRTLDT